MKKLFVPCVALALVVAAGCGGGGSSKNKAYANSVAAYAAALNSICRPALAKAKAMGLKTIADIAANGDKFKSLQNTTLDKLASLQPPDKIKSAADGFVSKSREEISKFGDLVAAAKSGDAAKVQQLGAEIQQLNAQSNQVLAGIGAATCAQGG